MTWVLGRIGRFLWSQNSLISKRLKAALPPSTSVLSCVNPIGPACLTMCSKSISLSPGKHTHTLTDFAHYHMHACMDTHTSQAACWREHLRGECRRPEHQQWCGSPPGGPSWRHYGRTHCRWPSGLGLCSFHKTPRPACAWHMKKGYEIMLWYSKTLKTD